MYFYGIQTPSISHIKYSSHGQPVKIQFDIWLPKHTKITSENSIFTNLAVLAVHN